MRFSFALKNQLIFKCVRADFLRGRRPSVKMALRVGRGTRSATFETQSEFVRKESTEMDFPAIREWRSPRLYPEECRAPPRRALQSPVYIRKKAAANKREKRKTQKFKKGNKNHDQIHCLLPKINR